MRKTDTVYVAGEEEILIKEIVVDEEQSISYYYVEVFIYEKENHKSYTLEEVCQHGIENRVDNIMYHTDKDNWVVICPSEYVPIAPEKPKTGKITPAVKLW